MGFIQTALTALRISIFYGWIIVGAVFLIGGTAAGTIYAFPAFFDAIAVTFGASRAEVSLVFAICEFIWFSAGFAGGFLADKYGPRVIVFCGSLLMAGGLTVAAASPSLSVLYGAYGAGVGVGGGLMYIPAISVVQRWFKLHRGLASGLAICGTGLGTLFFPLLASRLIESLGWAHTHYVFAAIVIAVCSTASLLLISHPRAIGRLPDGGSISGIDAPPTVMSGLPLAEAIKTAPFWYLYIACLFSAAAVFTTYVHLVPYALDNGSPTHVSVTLIGILGISSIIGRFIFGGVADRLGSRRTLALMFTGLGVSMLWWLMAPPILVNLTIYAIMFGIFYGGYIAILPVLCMGYFGGRQISGIIGCLYTSWGLGALLGPPATGFIFDLYHSYHYAILLSVLLLGASTASCILIKDPQHSY